MQKLLKKLDSFFGISARQSSFRLEILGGITTFLTMAYILFVNPSIMGGLVPDGNGGTIQLVAGLDLGAVFLATALAAGLTTLLMGLYAKLPVALAPGMGLNAFFSFTLVVGMGFSWQQALAAVLVSGVLYLIIALTGLRKFIVQSIPSSLKHAIGAGIGFFIAFIGLTNAGIIVQGAGTPLALGDLSTPSTLLALFGIVLTLVLLAFKVKAAVFFGIVGTAVAGLIAGFLGVQGMPFFVSLVSSAPSLEPTFGAAFGEVIPLITSVTGWTAIFAFLFVDFFDTAGTLMAVTSHMPFATEKDLERANHVDAIGTVAGSILGTSTTTSYIESLSGVGAGARTGLASVVTGLLFLLSIFFSPLLTLVTSSVTSAALIIVGTMMVVSLSKVVWEDWAIGVSAFITILMMILTYSISDGIGFGFLTYIIAMVASKRFKEVNWIMYLVAVLFLLHYIL